jgi:hypothetical protein
MPKTVRIAPEVQSSAGQTVTFVLAIGSVRQTCRLETTFRTESQASSYFRKYRTTFERLARDRFARGEINDGVINIAML